MSTVYLNVKNKENNVLPDLGIFCQILRFFPCYLGIFENPIGGNTGPEAGTWAGSRPGTFPAGL